MLENESIRGCDLRPASDQRTSEAKSEVPDWGIKSTLAYRVKVNSGTGLFNVHGRFAGSGHKVRL
jgi:hypothetical protein